MQNWLPKRRSSALPSVHVRQSEHLVMANSANSFWRMLLAGTSFPVRFGAWRCSRFFWDTPTELIAFVPSDKQNWIGYGYTTPMCKSRTTKMRKKHLNGLNNVCNPHSCVCVAPVVPPSCACPCVCVYWFVSVGVFLFGSSTVECWTLSAHAED